MNYSTSACMVFSSTPLWPSASASFHQFRGLKKKDASRNRERERETHVSGETFDVTDLR